MGNTPRGAERNPFRAEAFAFCPEQAEQVCERMLSSRVHNFLAAEDAPRPVWPFGGGEV